MTDLKRAFQDRVVTADKHFGNTLKEDYSGAKVGVHESIKKIVETLSSDIASIRDEGQQNGMKIKPGKRQEAYYATLRPVLNAAEDLAKAVIQNKGYSSNVPVDFFGKEEKVNLNAVDDSLTGAVNEWLSAVKQDGHAEMQGVGLPFDRNPIDRIHNILYQTTQGFRQLDCRFTSPPAISGPGAKL